MGLELASRFATLLGASRYGLSQRELADLLDAGDPQGNVAALLYLLRPYLMHRGELLDFYHSQFRAAVKNRYLADDKARRSVHLVLAEHFRRAADPEGRGEWDGNSTRGLRELPFHTAGSDDQAEVVALLTSLPYLSARVATGNAYQLAEDYALTAGPPQFVEWRDFIVRHSQRLTNHPKMLVALVQHEGFRSARLQVSSRTWRYPWLRTWEEPAPPGRPEPTGLHLEIKADKRFAHGRVSAVAWQARLIFNVERLGSIAILDYQDMEELRTRVSIGSGRPVKIACAPDASSLMVILEPGTAELYRCMLGVDGRPVAFELAACFSCCLPEIDDPVVEWHEDAYWMQIRPGMLARVDAVAAMIREEPLCGSAPGELGALIFFDDGRTFAAVRQGHSMILGGANGVSVRRVASDLCTACSCGDRAAVFFADGSAVVFDATETDVEMARIQSGIVRGAAGWDGKRLLWLRESADFAKLHSWRPDESAIQMVGGGQKVFPAGLHVIPRTWGGDGEGGTLLLTSHSVVRFHAAEGGSMRAGRMEWLFGGSTWRAVRKEDQAQWLWDGSAGSEVCLGTDVPGRLYCALDGRGQFYTARVDRPGMVWDLATLQTKPLDYSTMLFNMAVGDPEKGCWFSDRKGGIYYAGDDSQLRLVATVEDGVGAIVHVCGEHLLWWGMIPHYYADTGVDQGRAFVFFRRRPGTNQPLERIGERLFRVREGLCLAMDYDDTRGRLVLLWQPEGKYPVLRTATVEEFLADQFVDHKLDGAGLLGDSHVAISPDGRVLAILNSSRELICVSTDTGELVASLAGSLPFTHIAPGGEGSSFWLMQAHDAVYGCALVEPA